MLVLFETPAGYAIFKLLKEKKLKHVESLSKDFETPELAKKTVQLKVFREFKDTTEALAATAATVEGKVSKTLKKTLKSAYIGDIHDELAVADAKLGSAIQEKFDIKCVYNNAVKELMRCMREQLQSLVNADMRTSSLGLGHSFSRYKLKLTPDKVDIMVIQAVNLLDDIDKEINNYVMRLREWYGIHFPELAKLIADGQMFVRTVYKLGLRSNLETCDLSDILPEELEKEVKHQGDLSIGCDMEESDIVQIKMFCEQVIQIMERREANFEYITNRIRALCPNLAKVLGDLTAARMLSKAGSMTKLAKLPASTIQVLGAEKALFKAIKTKHDTPKYGLIYHSKYVQQANQKSKGKIARTISAKAALCVRVDALAETENCEVGLNACADIERRMKSCNEGAARKLAGSGKSRAQFDKYENKSYVMGNDFSGDSTLNKKRKFDDGDEEGQSSNKKRKLN